MSAQILTEVSATVAVDRETELVNGYHEITSGGVPDGLVRTELLHGPDRQWRVQTVWRDRAALEAVRARPEPPAALQLFKSVGADPVVRVYEVEDRHVAAP